MATRPTASKRLALALLLVGGLGCPASGEGNDAAAQAKVDAEVEAVRGQDPAVPPSPSGAPARGAGVPEDWAIEAGRACAWAWDPPGEVTTHMQAAAAGIKQWQPAGPKAGARQRHAQWDKLLDVAVQHASVAYAAAKSDPSAAVSPDGKTTALDAAWKATQMLDDAVRNTTPQGAAPTWARWGEASYLREVLRSMMGDDVVRPLAAKASETRFVVQDEPWRPRIDHCRAHRLQRGAASRR